MLSFYQRALSKAVMPQIDSAIMEKFNEGLLPTLETKQNFVLSMKVSEDGSIDTRLMVASLDLTAFGDFENSISTKYSDIAESVATDIGGETAIINNLFYIRTFTYRQESFYLRINIKNGKVVHGFVDKNMWVDPNTITEVLPTINDHIVSW